jgi:DNA repair exonuclease SbcCD ATPase subunit
MNSETKTAEEITIDHKRHEALRGRLQRLDWERQENKKQLEQVSKQIEQLKEYLHLAPEVTEALETLGAEIFEKDLKILQDKLTIALQEVLKQPVKFKAETSFKSNMVNVDFHIERDGNVEDIQRGQGGSVHNILSVGLRMFALTMLDDEKHRRFLMLDEQDCWLQPELVPHLVKIVHEAGKELGYQVIMISHHNLSLFSDYADAIYRFTPRGDQVIAEKVSAQPQR